MELASLALLATVGAGYGVPVDTLPSHSERLLVLWTNAARVAPEEFDNEYGGCSFADFEPSEQIPKNPLYIDLALTDVSRWHSQQMEANGCFQHNSCDGTNESFGARVARYYTDTGYVGENIAMGQADPRGAVMGMWMCSAGHRANIMNGDYNEMGPGVSGIYLTQDFAAGLLNEGEPPVRMAVDDGNGTWYADWGPSGGQESAPVELQLVLDGTVTDMSLLFGAPALGIYTVPAAESDKDDAAEDAASAPCQSWYVYWETENDSGTFPEAGSWLLGDCSDTPGSAANALDWTPAQTPRGGLFGDVPENELRGAMMDDLSLVGCAAVPGGASSGALGGLGLLLAAATVRRRRS